jgi:sugar-specific transcriptional regulator TrmB
MNKDILKEIGLTDYEIKIYLALLENGQLSAYQLAEKTGLYRQVIYDTLNRLVEKGYVNSVKEEKSQLYSALDPKLILEYLYEKTEGFKQILPDLNKIQNKSSDKVKVETYRGKNVLRIAFRDIINALKQKGGENLCTAVDEEFVASSQETIVDQYERDMLRFNIKERIVIKEGVRGRFKKGTSKYKRIPQKFFNPNPTQIYGDNVQIVLMGNPSHLIIIRSKEVAESYRKQFEFLWKQAKP